MKPNYTLLKIEGSLKIAVEGCLELETKYDALTIGQRAVLYLTRATLFLFRCAYPLPRETHN